MFPFTSFLLLGGSEDDVPTFPPAKFEPLHDTLKLTTLLLKKIAIAISIYILFH